MNRMSLRNYQGIVEVQDFRKTTDRFRGIYDIYLDLIKKSRKITTCNRLDLEPLRFWPIMHRNLPGHSRKGPKEVLIISRVDDRRSLEFPNIIATGAFRLVHKGWSCVSCSNTTYHMAILPFLVYLWFWSCVDGSRRELLSSVLHQLVGVWGPRKWSQKLLFSLLCAVKCSPSKQNCLSVFLLCQIRSVRTSRDWQDLVTVCGGISLL